MKKLLLNITALSMLVAAHTAYAGKGMLKIITDPGEAKIYINGKRKGTTPSEKGQTFAVKLPEGEYTITAEKAGKFGRWVGEKSDVFVGEDTLQTITIKLKLQLTDASGNKIQVPVVTSPSKLRQITDRYRSDSNRKKDFIPLGNGTVLDTRTGLQWMRCSLGQTWTGSTCSGEPSKYNWHQAINKSMSYASNSDWRLPTRFELETLVYCSGGKDEGRGKSDGENPYYLKFCEEPYQRPTIVKSTFPNTGGSDEYPIYWSSSTYVNYSFDAWVVDFSHGYNASNYKPANGHVRLVRGGQ